MSQSSNQHDSGFISKSRLTEVAIGRTVWTYHWDYLPTSPTTQSINCRRYHKSRLSVIIGCGNLKTRNWEGDGITAMWHSLFEQVQPVVSFFGSCVLQCLPLPYGHDETWKQLYYVAKEVIWHTGTPFIENSWSLVLRFIPNSTAPTLLLQALLFSSVSKSQKIRDTHNLCAV